MLVTAPNFVSDPPSCPRTMIGENRQLVTDEAVDVQYCRIITDHSRGIYRVSPNFNKEFRRISTCNRLDLQTLGSQLIMPQNLPDHGPRNLVSSELGLSLTFHIGQGFSSLPS